MTIYIIISIIASLVFTYDSYLTRDAQFKNWHKIVWFVLHVFAWPLWLVLRIGKFIAKL